MSPKITLYTSTVVDFKKLDNDCQVAFTFSTEDPATSTKKIIYQIVKLRANVTMSETITWDNGSYGFSIINSVQDGVVTRGHSTPVPLKKKAILTGNANQLYWDQDQQTLDDPKIGVVNASSTGARLALSVYKGQQPIPVVDLGSLQPGGTQKYEPPVMIQGYRLEQDNTVGKIVTASDLPDKRAIFRDNMKEPQPIDASSLNQEQKYLVYSNARGEIIFEQTD